MAETMRAVVHHQYGGPEVLQLKTDVVVPKCKANQVLIRVHSVSLNPVDWKELKGMLQNVPNFVRQGASETTHASVGYDVAGVIVQVGSSVTNLKIDDEVFAMAHPLSTGTFADYVAIDQYYVAIKPKSISFDEAASLPLVSLTSYQSLFTKGGLKPKQNVLILGGSGGTGSIAIQLARWKDAHITVTCSGRNADFVRSLGADRVIDYTKEQFAQVLEHNSFDLIYDCIGGPAAWQDAQLLLKKSGRFVTIVGDENVEFEPFSLLKAGYMIVSRAVWAFLGRSPFYCLYVTKTNATDLTKIAQLVDEGQLKAIIDSTFALEDVAKAFERSISGRARGKIVIQVSK